VRKLDRENEGPGVLSPVVAEKPIKQEDKDKVLLQPREK
jgi:hypothetical protein